MHGQAWVHPPGRGPGAGDSDVYLSMVGVFRSEDQARRLGYHTTRSTTSDAAAYEATLTETEQQRYHTASYGPEDAPYEEARSKDGMVIAESTKGCVAEGRAAVYGSVAAHLEGSLLRNEASHALGDTHTGLTPSDGALYQQCMARSGHIVSGFNAFDIAGKKFGQYRKPGDPPSPEESAMATADFACQEELGLMNKLRDNYVKQAGDWVLANEQRLLQWRDTVQQALQRARKIING